MTNIVKFFDTRNVLYERMIDMLGAWLIQHQDNAHIKKIFNECAQRSSLNAWIIA
jgi:hypothetical protein